MNFFFFKLICAIGLGMTSLMGALFPLFMIHVMGSRGREKKQTPRNSVVAAAPTVSGERNNNPTTTMATSGTNNPKAGSDNILSDNSASNSAVGGSSVVVVGEASDPHQSLLLHTPPSVNICTVWLYFSTEMWLGLANTCSAGLLIGAGLLHFFGECASQMALAELHPSHEVNETEKRITDGLYRAIQCLVIGIVVPLLVDRVILRHFGGAGEGNLDGGADNPHHHVSANAIIIAVLLSMHSMMEGLALGVETSFISLRTGMIPMLLHKFFDGLILGVSLAKREQSWREQAEKDRVGQSKVAEEVLLEGGDVNTSSSSFSLPVWWKQSTAWYWSSVTPFVMIATLIISATHTSSEEPSTDPSSFSSPSHHAASHSILGATFQGIGAGTFLYIALVEIIPEEFGGNKHPPAA